MFIEFNGIPGCGKSTICKRLIASLVDSGEDVLFLQDNIVKISKYKAVIPFLILAEVVHGAGVIVRAYIDFYNSLPVKNIETIIRTFAAMKNAMLAYRMCRKNETTIIISDQCIVQNIVSCFYNHPIQNDVVIENLLNTVGSKIGLFVEMNVEIDIETANNRIQDRNTKGGRLDHLRGNQLTDMLSKQAVLLKHVRTLNNGLSVTIDSSISIDDNVKVLNDYIKGVVSI